MTGSAIVSEYVCRDNRQKKRRLLLVNHTVTFIPAIFLCDFVACLLGLLHLLLVISDV